MVKHTDVADWSSVTSFIDRWPEELASNTLTFAAFTTILSPTSTKITS
jgi:hypothetical protein